MIQVTSAAPSSQARTLLEWALLPAADDVLDMLIQKGQKDTRSWAESVGLAGSAVILK